MTAHDIGSLDVRLMRTLLLLLTECSVSRTADLLGQAQPTVSLTLKRLRDMFNDPLLVRSGSALNHWAYEGGAFRPAAFRGPARRYRPSLDPSCGGFLRAADA